MEKLIFNKDIIVFYKTANSFPDGILEAHQSLHTLIPYTSERKYFGISRPENGKIVYRAAAEETYPGEGKKLNCQSMILPGGTYIAATIKDFRNHIAEIEKTFRELMNHPDIDPEGYCVEWYYNEMDVKCMIRLIS